ncbi:MAG TPA: potassium channel family protein [Candidatus Binatus sp.]|jgi:ion channel|nr:potassium channel family protein [Candidatus Binatus sp.]
MKLGTPLVVGCLMIASMVLVQATAITAILRLVRRQVPRSDTIAHWVHNVGVAAQALLIMVAAQLVQIAAWAALFVACREFDDFSTAFYHSAVNFTTLGYGDIVMSPSWKLLGPLEAVAGMLMFGVSTAGLFRVTETLIHHREGPRIG